MYEEKTIIKQCDKEHLERYGEIYAAAFSGEPWNAAWKIEDAITHISELLESDKSFGLEFTINNQVVGFILGTSILFHYGRVFDINDLAVDPAYQRRGIAKQLMEHLLSNIKEQGMVGVHLITIGEGILPDFYKKFGFQKENEVILMGKDL